MRKQIIFNEAMSYDDYEVLLKEYPVLPLPSENIETLQVQGRSGSLTFKDGTFSDMNLSLNLILKNKSNLEIVLDWLTYINDNRLYFNLTDDKCYKVKSCNIATMQEDSLDCLNLSVAFSLEPFLYPIEESYKDIKKGEEVNYRGYKTEPIVEFVASGNVQIIINDTIMQLAGVNGKIIIDSENMTVRSEEGQSLLDKTTGNFFSLKTGKNTISWVGSVSNFKILYNSKYRW